MTTLRYDPYLDPLYSEFVCLVEAGKLQPLSPDEEERLIWIESELQSNARCCIKPSNQQELELEIQYYTALVSSLTVEVASTVECGTANAVTE